MIYTKTGDHGTTSLVGGSRVSKDDLRVEAYGTVDELNAHLGVLTAMAAERSLDIAEDIKQIQHDLFVIQTLLATPDEQRRTLLPQLEDDRLSLIENKIDALEKQLPPLQSFVIPGGNLPAAQCHVARTVCRRAERRIVSLSRQCEIPIQILPYVNRLSDYLFLLSRRFLQLSNDAESYISIC